MTDLDALASGDSGLATMASGDRVMGQQSVLSGGRVELDYDKVRIDGRVVGKFGNHYAGWDSQRRRYGERCTGIQISWAIDIPPTRFHANSRSEREIFALLFAERHAARLLRAFEKRKGRLAADRAHTKPYELGMCLYYYWPLTDEQDEQSRWAWILDRRGDRLELLFEGTAEPVIVRKDVPPPGAEAPEPCCWDIYDDFPESRFHESRAVEANEKRSAIATRRARNSDGTFVHDPTYVPVAPKRRTGIDVGALIAEMQRLR